MSAVPPDIYQAEDIDIEITGIALSSWVLISNLLGNMYDHFKMRLLPCFLATLWVGGSQHGFVDAVSNYSSVPGALADWTTARGKADAFLAQLNLTEKVGIVTGASTLVGGGTCIGNIAPITRLNFSGICYSDGPAAVNRHDLVSVFPSGITLAATWDMDLIYEKAAALGQEFRDKGTHVGLGPVAGPLGRHPLGGRNWEGFSPDPYLTGQAMMASIQGQQSVTSRRRRGAILSLRTGTEIKGISANIDDRTLHELYLWPFADAVRSGTTSVMCSYNRVNETYSCENSELLTKILKEELGFEGYVVSDWFAGHSGVPSANAGLDLLMPGYISQETIATGDSYFGRNLTQAVQNGSVAEARLDDMVRRVMTPYFLLGQDQDYPTVDPSSLTVLGQTYGVNVGPQIPARDVRRNHSALIRAVAAAGTVLLKNTNNTLPLAKPLNIGIFGNDAPDPTDGLTYLDPAPFPYGFDIGTLDIGGGSGSGRHSSLVSPLDAVKARASTYGARVQYLTSNQVIAEGKFASIYPTPDVCLVFLKTFASEGTDRTAFEPDWNSTAVVTNVARECSNTVVVTHSAGVNTLPWANNPNVTAILAAHYPGEQSGNSIVDVLFGDVNPSGKLPYTIPLNESDYYFPIVNLTNATDPNAWQSNFTEGLFIDYRHFDAKNLTPLYEFGYGLSYTTFELGSSLSVDIVSKAVSESPDSSLKTVPGGNPDLYTTLAMVSTSISNTGSKLGATVVQLYLSFPQDSVPDGTPLKVLRGFQKISLAPEETKSLNFNLTRRDLSYWDVVKQDWVIPAGDINVLVGFSSRDLSVNGSVKLY
ncbi:glycosyl hydrolase family 3 N terminal domain-containing protein [Rutstroemia sp. NJR-2017a WRK4]|nr:glycosyl hydrolase family 3 N terminal domain-containing protein [Rutstroemia sp. NJR-2017a WRK4]